MDRRSGIPGSAPRAAARLRRDDSGRRWHGTYVAADNFAATFQAYLEKKTAVMYQRKVTRNMLENGSNWRSNTVFWRAARFENSDIRSVVQWQASQDEPGTLVANSEAHMKLVDKRRRDDGYANFVISVATRHGDFSVLVDDGLAGVIDPDGYVDQILIFGPLTF